MVDNDHRLASCCKQLRFDVNIDPLRLISDFHTSPPKLIVIQLENQYCVAYVEVCHTFVFKSFSCHFTYEIHCLVHLQSYFSLDAQLAVLVRPPAIKLAVIHQSYGVCFAALNFFHLHLLFSQKILKMLIFDRKFVVCVITITESRIFSISPVVDLLLIVEDYAKIATSCNPLNFHALQSFDFCRSSDG